MRIQWDNILERADTLSATNEDPNYPVTRLIENTNRTLFRSTGASSVITATFPSDESVSCIAVGNHNVDSLTLTLKDSVGATIGSPYVYDATDFVFVDGAGKTFNTEIQYFEVGDALERVDGVREIEIDVTGFAIPLFIGGISLGPCLQMPNIAVRPDVPVRHTGGGTKTPAGVLFDNPGILLEQFKATLAVVTIPDADSVSDTYSALGVGKVMYLDRWEGVDEFRAYLANFTGPSIPRVKHPGPLPLVLRNVKVAWEECR